MFVGSCIQHCTKNTRIKQKLPQPQHHRSEPPRSQTSASPTPPSPVPSVQPRLPSHAESPVFSRIPPRIPRAPGVSNPETRTQATYFAVREARPWKCYLKIYRTDRGGIILSVAYTMPATVGFGAPHDGRSRANAPHDGRSRAKACHSSSLLASLPSRNRDIFRDELVDLAAMVYPSILAFSALYWTVAVSLQHRGIRSSDRCAWFVECRRKGPDAASVRNGGSGEAGVPGWTPCRGMCFGWVWRGS